MCGRNFPIDIPAHTCVTGNDYDFSTELTAIFDLPPGRYALRHVEVDRREQDLCKPLPETPFRANPEKDLVFTVLQP
jgi:hypothetical protein